MNDPKEMVFGFSFFLLVIYTLVFGQNYTLVFGQNYTWFLVKITYKYCDLKLVIAITKFNIFFLLISLCCSGGAP
jgi:hypothetical protein